MRSRKKNSEHVLADSEMRPLSDSEVVALGYDPQDDGWHPIVRHPADDRPADPQLDLEVSTPSKVTPLRTAAPTSVPTPTPAPKRRQGRTGRPSRPPRTR